MRIASVIIRLLFAFSLLAPVADLDQHVQHAVQDARRPEYEPVMRGASNSRQGSVVIGTLLIVAIATGPAGPATARTALFALAPVNVVTELMKRGFHRVRPDGTGGGGNASFPSSHAANACALALVMSLRWPRLSTAFWLFAATVAFSRIYLNKHFLSDVLVGAALGVGLAWLTVEWLRRRGWTWHSVAGRNR